MMLDRHGTDVQHLWINKLGEAMKFSAQKFILTICAALLLAPVNVSAQDDALVLPDTFAVKDVADDDVLNIRSLPGTDGEIIGSLGPAAESIEVIRLSEDGRWGLVNQAEQAGWVSMRFMENEQSEYALLDRQLSCSGTEPFWGFSFMPDGPAQFNDSNLSEEPIDLVTGWKAKQWYHRGGPEIAEFKSENRVLTASFTRGYCDDGMSDYEYGIVFVGHLTDGALGMSYSGCCSLTRW